MFIKINTRSDRRLVKAVLELMADDVAAGHIVTTATIIFIEHDNPIALLESALDRVLPYWRANRTAHAYRQGNTLTQELMLLRVWHLCLEQNTDLEPGTASTPAEPEPVKEKPEGIQRATLASLYGVPAEWLVVVPLETEPKYYLFDAREPTEKYVRRPQRVLKEPVRCGKCSDQVEYNERGKHATIHAMVVADIEWSPVTRFRRA